MTRASVPMQRRKLITFAAAAAGGGAVWAQGQRVARVGILTPNLRQPRVAGVIQAVGELGYLQGRNLVVLTVARPRNARLRMSTASSKAPTLGNFRSSSPRVSSLYSIDAR